MESSIVIGGEPGGRPLGLHTSSQIPKVKGLQSAYMVALLGTFGAKNLASGEEFGYIKNGNPNSSEEVKLFFNIINQNMINEHK